MKCSDNKVIYTALIALVIGAGAGWAFGKRSTCTKEDETIVGQHCDLRHKMVRLWTDHVIWTRACIVATMQGTPDEHAVHERLLKNQEDLGQTFAHYYGVEKGQAFTRLLKEHSSIMHDMVYEAKAHHHMTDKTHQAWQQNEQDLVTFLSNLNPTYWPQDEIQPLLTEHLLLIHKEVLARLEGNWDEDIRIFDAICNQARKMARIFADGIVDQHPAHF